jgi:curved DNA-binding protein
MSPLKDYYDILGISEATDGEALKRAYRALAREYHPDRNPGNLGAAEFFKQIQEAYAVLGNPERRRAYDGQRRLLRIEVFEHSYHFSGEIPHSSPDGSASGTCEPMKERVHLTVALTFDQALRGGHTEVTNPEGEIVRVTIPKGCPDGVTMCLRGRGGRAAAGDPADLYVTFRVQPHPRFRREGNHLRLIETISAVEAIVGTTRSITNAYGHTIRLPIPPGTQPGERLRLRGQGVVTAREKGDLFVEIDVQIPRELSDDQRAQLLRAAQDLGLL